MAKERRVLRLQQLILEIVAETIQGEIQDPRVGMVSVTRVKLSPDLTTATVFWSVLGDDAAKRTTSRGLEDALGLIQARVAQSMATRVTPRLSLRFDESMEKAQRINDIFHRLALERGETPDAEGVGAAARAAPADPEDDEHDLEDEAAADEAAADAEGAADDGDEDEEGDDR